MRPCGLPLDLRGNYSEGNCKNLAEYKSNVSHATMLWPWQQKGCGQVYQQACYSSDTSKFINNWENYSKKDGTDLEHPVMWIPTKQRDSIRLKEKTLSMSRPLHAASLQAATEHPISVWERRPVRCDDVETPRLMFNYTVVQVSDDAAAVHKFLMLVTEADRGSLLPCGPVQPVFSELVPSDPPEWMSGWAPTSMWWDRWKSHPAMNSPSQRAPTCSVSLLAGSSSRKDGKALQKSPVFGSQQPNWGLVDLNVSVSMLICSQHRQYSFPLT